MDAWLTFTLIFWGLACFCFGFWYAKLYFARAFKMFSDEMHRQYLMLLERQGIKLNGEGKKLLRSIRE